MQVRAAPWVPLLIVSSCATPRCDLELGPDTAAALQALAAADQEARAALVSWSRENPGRVVPPALGRAVTAADEASRAFLLHLVDHHCWPRVSDVGAEAARSAWLIAQHADDDVALQERVHALMEPLVEVGEAFPSDFALLTDRILVARGAPQRYGTQFRSEVIDGVLHFGPATPIEDRVGVDERRAEVGLIPLAEYVRSLREVYGVPEDAPAFGDE